MADAVRPEVPDIQDYQLLRLIGRGSYGEVWLAKSQTGILRAVKIVWRDRFAEREPYEREFRGVKEFATVSLTEPRLLALLHVGVSERQGFFYYVMELADDANGAPSAVERYVPLTLNEYRRRHGVLTAPQCVALGAELARALQALHQRHLVHRDIKGSNIVYVGGVLKLADIGLVSSTEHAVTFVGTEGFVPPEGPGAPAADVFSLGKVLYEIATGLDRKEYPSLPGGLAERPDFTDFLELNQVITRACDPDSRVRYASAQELLEDLLLLQAGDSVKRLRSAERRLSRAIRVGIALAGVAVVAATGAYIERQRAAAETLLRQRAEQERDAIARRVVYAATLAQTQQALERVALRRARDLLNELRPHPGERDARGIEWGILNDLAKGDAIATRHWDDAPIERILGGPRGAVAVHSANQKVRVLHADGTLRATIDGVHRLAGWSSDGLRLFGTDPAAQPVAWTIEDGAQERGPGEGRVHRPIGMTSEALVSFIDGHPPALETWEFAERDPARAIRRIEDVAGEFYAAGLGRSGEVLALVLLHGRGPTATWSFEIRRSPSWRAEHGVPLWTRADVVAVSPDESRVLLAMGHTSEVALWSVRDGTWSVRRPGGFPTTTGAAFAPDGGRFALTDGNEIRVFDTVSGERVRTLHASGDKVTALAWRTPEEILAGTLAGEYCSYILDRALPGRRVDGLWQTPSGGPNVCLSPTGDRLVTSLDGHDSVIIELAGMTLGPRIPHLVQPLAWRGTEVWGFGDRGELLRVSEQDLARSDRFLLPSSHLGRSHPASARRGATFVFGRDDGTVYFGRFDAPEHGRVVAGHRGAIWWATLSDDGRYACTSGEDRAVVLWDVDHAVERARFRSDQPALHAAFSPDGQVIAVARDDGTVELVRGADGQPYMKVNTGGTQISSVLFSPDGRRLLCGGDDATLYVLETEGWTQVCALSADLVDKAAARADLDLLAVTESHSVIGRLTAGQIVLWRSSE